MDEKGFLIRISSGCDTANYLGIPDSKLAEYIEEKAENENKSVDNTWNILPDMQTT